MNNEIPKPVVIGAIVCLVIVLVIGGLAFMRSSSGDLSNVVVQPKPWAPPGGAGKFHPGAPGAPAGAPAPTK